MALKLVHQAVFAAMIICGIFLARCSARSKGGRAGARQHGPRLLARDPPAGLARLGHTAQEAVRTTFPVVVAQARAIATATRHHSPPSAGGLLVPSGARSRWWR